MIGEVLDENVFLTGVKQGEGSGGNKKLCPIRCGRTHVNSSLFFCNKFRKKEQEERKAIQQKLLNLCILCLGWKNAQHICPVKKCPRCGAGHNVLLCPKEDPDRAFVISERACEEEWTEDPESLVDPDRCYMVRKHKAPEVKGDRKIQLEEVKAILKELSAEQRRSNKEDDKAAFLQSARCDQVRLIRELETHENLIHEEDSSSESLTDKSIETESEAEFVTASASSTQVSSGGSDLELKRKHMEAPYKMMMR